MQHLKLVVCLIDGWNLYSGYRHVLGSSPGDTWGFSLELFDSQQPFGVESFVLVEILEIGSHLAVPLALHVQILNEFQATSAIAILGWFLILAFRFLSILCYLPRPLWL